MNNNILISIIIPCYNVGKYIARCYDSLANQKNADKVEFIFINDGSKDKTLSILHDIKSKDNRVIIIDQENKGVSAARNSALNVIRGKYVYLLDGDDFLPNGVIKSFIEIIDNYQPDIVLPAYNISKDGVEKFIPLPLKDGLYDKCVLFKNIMYFPTANQLIYRSDIIYKYKISFDNTIKCGEVYTFTINYLKYVNSIYLLNKPCFNYFQRSNSATHSSNYQNDISVINAIESIYANGNSINNYCAFSITAFKLWIYFTYLKYAHLKYTQKAEETIITILSNNIIRKNIKDVIVKKHNSFKYKLLAIYIYIMPKRLGFKLINWFLLKRDELTCNNKH